MLGVLSAISACTELIAGTVPLQITGASGGVSKPANFNVTVNQHNLTGTKGVSRGKKANQGWSSGIYQ